MVEPREEKLVRYRSNEEDSERWQQFGFRDGDIVISSRSKHGTTWVQMVCALLIFQTSRLPRPLSELSPWLDWLVLPIEDLQASLRSHKHRRFIKTHTPLDGLPSDDRATFLVVARHPLDAAVSLHYQSQNIDRDRIADIIGDPSLAKPRRQRPPLEEQLLMWTKAETNPLDSLDSFNGVFHHLTDAWNRRGQSNVLLVHYADLLHDLVAEMQRISTKLGIGLSTDQIRDLASAASFESMKADADVLAPDPGGVLKDKSRFFRSGKSGAGGAALKPQAVEAYNRRAAELAPPDLLEWLHR